MIYYASSHKEGAETLAAKYDLEPLPAKKYISEESLTVYTCTLTHSEFFDAIQVHPSVHAYVLRDLRMHFHPNAMLEIIGVSYQEYFKNFV